jgi:hypothetical protein
MDYKLIYFIHTKKQKKYIEKNINRIVSIILLSFPSNIELFEKKVLEKEKEYIEIMKKIIMNASEWSIWFFCVEKETDKIVGMCFLYETKLSYYEGKEKIETYKKISPKELSFDIYENRKFKKFYPVINGICKVPGYKNVGKFIIKELTEYLKLKTKYKQMYIICESSIFKYNYKDYINENRCIYNQKYNGSNIEFIKYYKSNGFRILKKIFDVYECIPITGSFMPDVYGDIICFNVMSKKIN